MQQRAHAAQADDPQETDEALVRAVQAGDRQALARLYARYAASLRSAAVRLVRDPAQAEDLLHDVFCEAWRSAASYEPARASVRTWLLIRLRSRAMDQLRQLRQIRQRHRAAQRTHKMAQGGELLTDSAEGRYLALAMGREVERLPAAQRRLLELVFFHELPLPEVAAELGWPLGTVKSRLHRLLRALNAEPGAEPVPGLPPPLHA